jgi:putative transposase
MVIGAKRKINSFDFWEILADLFLAHGNPAFLRSDNGTEFIAKQLQGWLYKLNASTLYVKPGRPEENCFGEFFNGKLTDKILNG